jgi:radical SAM superfamily enzyme YgiQ (UPF0313 family)
MKRILLINPAGRKSGYMLSKFSLMPPLGLAYVAAVTPAGYNISILDENFDAWTGQEADLVGITAFTSTINRAYEIAAHYRGRGIPVVLGGIHASMLPDEASRHADAVVVGEAETAWPRLLADLAAGKLNRIYTGDHVDLGRTQVLPRRDLLHPGYLWQPIQTSRGCPFNCSFCSVSRYLGLRYRQRTAADVLAELRGIPQQSICFLDDNLIGHTAESKARAKAIFSGMIAEKMHKRWWMQASINLAEDEEVVRLAAKAGCMFALIGFETTDDSLLSDMGKGVNLKTGTQNYAAVVSTLHRHGIGVLGAFIIGNDGETEQTYRDIADLIIHAGVDIVQVSILTPLPGTRLMEQLTASGRVILDDYPADWDKYRFSYLTHRPEGPTADAVYRGNNYIKQRIYAPPLYQIRLLRSAIALRRPASAWAVYRLNQALKTSWRHAHYHTGLADIPSIQAGSPAQ